MASAEQHSQGCEKHKPSVRGLQARAYAAWISQGTESRRKSSVSSFDAQRAARRAVVDDDRAEALIMRY